MNITITGQFEEGAKENKTAYLISFEDQEKTMGETSIPGVEEL